MIDQYQNDDQYHEQHAQEFKQWTIHMQELESLLKDKKCPFCQSKSLEPTSLHDFLCTICNNTGFIKSII